MFEPSTMNLPAQSEIARHRILHVAAEMFVAHGFKGTTIRKICERAHVNVSMVNYYFHSKEDLYLAVLDFARQQEIKEASDEGDVVAKNLTPEEKLHRAIENFLKNLLLPGPNSLLTKLITRELTNPSGAIHAIIADDIRPQHQYFASLIRAIAGSELSDEEVQKCIFSIIGQALFYAHNRPINELIAPAIYHGEDGIKQIAEHIHRFTLAALKHYRNN